MPYTYHKSPIIIPKHAEITAAFRQGNGLFSDLVQQAINEVEPWEQGEDPIEAFDLPHAIGSRTVLLASIDQVVWGVNPHHKARQPGLSPFVRLDSADDRQSTKIATLELSGTVEKPILTRIYPGEYMPPLPWMMSAPRADGGRQACVDYWDHHAFVLNTRHAPAKLTHAAPDWYQAGA